MSPVEILGLRATADKPASREIRDPLAAGETVEEGAMPTAAALALAVAAEVAGIAAEAEVAGIAVAEKRADEEFQ
jgi:hypothetical protein